MSLQIRQSILYCHDAAAPATYTGYAPIVPAANVSTAGIAGLPSTDTSTIQPYTFTAFTPDAYTPAVPCVLAQDLLS